MGFYILAAAVIQLIKNQMINRQLLDPRSIVILGGSNDIQKPGGKILKNIIDGGYTGGLYVVNPKEDRVQNITSFRDLSLLPQVDLAIMAIAAKHIPASVEILANQKNTKAFIIISAGFSEESHEGKLLEAQVVDIVNKAGGCLIGPNCIGVLTPAYHGVFTLPIPRLSATGCDFISGSGATACFIMENGIQKGLSFARVFSVGNSAQLGVEDILQYMDETYEPGISPSVKLLYIESVNKPQLLLKHSASLIRKGCRIAAVKAGASEAGSRAASSHTGALASSDLAVETLFRKAGIVRCNGREELINVASVFLHKKLNGKNIGVITHAGGPAVMLTDALSREGFQVPRIENPKAPELLSMLFPGSSVTNPIDFLATGTAEQLGYIIDYTDRYFTDIDGMAVIFGTPGLFPIHDVYDVLDEKMKTASKPVFPILPSTFTAKEEVDVFLNKGRINFPDEVLFARALGLAYNTPPPAETTYFTPAPVQQNLLKLTAALPSGYLSPENTVKVLDLAGIPRVPEFTVLSAEDLIPSAEKCGFPLVMKVIGPLHKSDAGGVRLNIKTLEEVKKTYFELMNIREASGVLLQPMLKGTELFAGIKHEPKFGHMILCGMGGIFIEILKDFSTGLAPISADEAADMIRRLKIFPLLQGARGQQGIDLDLFRKILTDLSNLSVNLPAIREMDLNPLLASPTGIVAVDCRIKLENDKIQAIGD